MKVRNRLVDNFSRIDQGKIRLRRPGKEHHVGDHLVNPHGLRIHKGKRPAPLGIGLPVQKQLGPAGDYRQRIIDFVARPGGELGHGLELFRFHGLLEFIFQCCQPCQNRLANSASFTDMLRTKEKQKAEPIPSPGSAT